LRVAIVVPLGGTCPHRKRAWAWVRGRYAEHHADWEVIEAPVRDGEWCKGAAVNPVVAEIEDGEIVIQADADCWTDGLAEAVAAVEDGVGWAVPHRFVHRLSEGATAAVLGGEDWREQTDLGRPAYEGLLGGGIVVTRAETLRAAPLDPRFLSWGQEDESHAYALDCLFGTPWRGIANLVHLYHPPQPRASRRKGSAESWELRRRYRRASLDPDAMSALLEEARCPSPA
jgi:hypothetical protein